MEGNRLRTYILKSPKKKKSYLTNWEIPISQLGVSNKTVTQPTRINPSDLA